MKRRRFLSLMGAATTAPLLPLPALAAAPAPALYSKAAWHGAILHAQSTRYLSAFGLARALSVPADQAQALMGDLARRGIVTPLAATNPGSRWATSRVTHPAFARQPRAKRQHREARPQNATDHKPAPAHTGTPNIDLLLAHLRTLSFDYFAARAA